MVSWEWPYLNVKHLFRKSKVPQLYGSWVDYLPESLETVFIQVPGTGLIQCKATPYWRASHYGSHPKYLSVNSHNSQRTRTVLHLTEQFSTFFIILQTEKMLKLSRQLITFFGQSIRLTTLLVPFGFPQSYKNLWALRGLLGTWQIQNGAIDLQMQRFDSILTIWKHLILKRFFICQMSHCQTGWSWICWCFWSLWPCWATWWNWTSRCFWSCWPSSKLNLTPDVAKCGLLWPGNVSKMWTFTTILLLFFVG